MNKKLNVKEQSILVYGTAIGIGASIFSFGLADFLNPAHINNSGILVVVLGCLFMVGGIVLTKRMETEIK